MIKGVIAARDGRFAEASSLWRKAKALEPGYPNIDRLIEEAEKRKVRVSCQLPVTSSKEFRRRESASAL